MFGVFPLKLLFDRGVFFAPKGGKVPGDLYGASVGSQNVHRQRDLPSAIFGVSVSPYKSCMVTAIAGFSVSL